MEKDSQQKESIANCLLVDFATRAMFIKKWVVPTTMQAGGFVIGAIAGGKVGAVVGVAIAGAAELVNISVRSGGQFTAQLNKDLNAFVDRNWVELKSMSTFKAALKRQETGRHENLLLSWGDDLSPRLKRDFMIAAAQTCAKCSAIGPIYNFGARLLSKTKPKNSTLG